MAISLVDGYAQMEQLPWDNFNESMIRKTAVDPYVQRHRTYPEAILADPIYQNRENLCFCKQYGIRLSGPSWGVRKKIVLSGRMPRFATHRRKIQRRETLLRIGAYSSMPSGDN